MFVVTLAVVRCRERNHSPPQTLRPIHSHRSGAGITRGMMGENEMRPAITSQTIKRKRRVDPNLEGMKTRNFPEKLFTETRDSWSFVILDVEDWWCVQGQFYSLAPSSDPQITCATWKIEINRINEIKSAWSHLEQVDVSVRVAQTEDVLLLGMFGDGLDDAVVGQQSVARRKLALGADAFPVSLIKQQSATWGDRIISYSPSSTVIQAFYLFVPISYLSFNSEVSRYGSFHIWITINITK